MTTPRTETGDAPEMARTKFAKDQLKAFVERIERLEDEKKAIADDIGDVYQEAKGDGFDVKAMRALIRLRKQEATERNEHQLILETYMNALGMLASTPLGTAATERALHAARSSRSRDAEFDDTKVTISTAGMKPIETTAGALRKAADRMKTPAGKRAMRRAAATVGDMERAADLINPKAMPSDKSIKDIADRAEKRSRDSGGGEGGSSPPPQGAPPQAAPVPAAASADNSRGGDGVAPTCSVRRCQELVAPFAGEAPGPRETEVAPQSAEPAAASAAGELSPVLGPAPPPSVREWRTPVVFELEDTDGIPGFLLIGHPDCLRGNANGPPEVRPP